MYSLRQLAAKLKYESQENQVERLLKNDLHPVVC